MHLQYILMIKHHFRITDLKMHPLVQLRMLHTSKKKKNRIGCNIFKRLWEKNFIKLLEESYLLTIYKTNKFRKII